MHSPMAHRATGSPTTATKDLVRVRAVLRSLGSDKKAKSVTPPTDSASYNILAICSLSKRWCVRTVEIKRARNSRPKNKIKKILKLCCTVLTACNA